LISTIPSFNPTGVPTIASTASTNSSIVPNKQVVPAGMTNEDLYHAYMKQRDYLSETETVLKEEVGCEKANARNDGKDE